MTVSESSIRRLLAEQHPVAADIRQIAADAGLDVGRIVFQGSAENMWFNVLEEAAKHRSVDRILQAARSAAALRVHTAVILTALEVEYQAVRSHLGEIQERTHLGTVYETGRFPAAAPIWRVSVAEIGPHNPGAASAAERALSYFKPSVILLVGIAGGLKDVAIGDVVCATKVYGYESGKETPDGFRPRPIVFNTSAALLSRARAEKRRWNREARALSVLTTFRVFDGPIAAGEKVVASSLSSTAILLRENYSDALAVEMEGVGFLAAAHASQAACMVIRGISDLLDRKSEADAIGSQEIASHNAALIAFRMLAGLGRGRADDPSSAD